LASLQQALVKFPRHAIDTCASDERRRGRPTILADTSAALLTHHGCLHVIRDAIHPTISELWALIATASQPVIVEVGAEGCFPCKKLRPFLRKFATELNNSAIIVAIDTAGNKEFAREWQIDSVPQLLLFRNGELSERIREFVVLKDMKLSAQRSEIS
jgi:thioredoxin 1